MKTKLNTSKFRITNRVYTVDAFPTDCLKDIRAPGYRPPTPEFRAGIVKTGTGTVLIYPNGRGVVVGCRRKRDIARSISKCANTVGVLLDNPRLVNLAGSGNVGGPLRLHDVRALIPGAYYEPDHHPGLLFHVGSVSVIMYTNGTVMFVGNRSYAYLRYTVRYIHRVLEQYRINRAVAMRSGATMTTLTFVGNAGQPLVCKPPTPIDFRKGMHVALVHLSLKKEGYVVLANFVDMATVNETTWRVLGYSSYDGPTIYKEARDTGNVFEIEVVDKDLKRISEDVVAVVHIVYK